MAQFNLTSSVGLLYVAALRDFFASSPLAELYRWSTDPDKRVLEIVEQWPETARKLPLIVVDTVYGGEAERYISNQGERIIVGSEHVGDYKSGTDTLDVRITANDYSKATVDEITDLVVFALKRHVEIWVWENSVFNVQPQRQARGAGAGGRLLTDVGMIFFNTVAQSVKSTWYDEVLYTEKILTYLATAERERIGLEGTIATQFQAD